MRMNTDLAKKILEQNAVAIPVAVEDGVCFMVREQEALDAISAALEAALPHLAAPVDPGRVALDFIAAASFDVPDGYVVEEHLPGIWHFTYGDAGNPMASLASWNNKAHATVAAWKDALAARQPVGEAASPYGWLLDWATGPFGFTTAPGVAADHREYHNCKVIPLYAAPPQQPEMVASQPKNGEVYVEVSGLTGTGKSGVAGEIEVLCKALGLEVEWVNGDEEKRLTHADWIGELEMYKPRVVISERNIPRTAINQQESKP